MNRTIAADNPYKPILGRMRVLTEAEQDEILRRFVARQKKSEVVAELQRRAEARVGLILEQLRADFAELGRI